MPVYVDKPLHRLGRMTMCHMLADTEAELHAMADLLGLRRAWFQIHGTPHYDICKAKRKLALAAGAIEINRHETVRLIRKLRAQAAIQENYHGHFAQEQIAGPAPCANQQRD